MVKQRIEYYDLCKAITIYLVVLGHIITEQWGDNSILRMWIYSFHVPMFMFLSGVFFKTNLKKNLKDVVFGNFYHLMVPFFVWNTLYFFLLQIPTIKHISALEQCYNFFICGGILHGFWYLKCLYIYILGACIVYRFSKNELFTALITIVVYWILPDISGSSIMIVFFWIGHFFGKYNGMLFNAGLLKVALFAIVFYLFVMYFWKPEYAYDNIVLNPKYILFRTIAGVSASIFFICASKMVCDYFNGTTTLRKLIEIGTNTLGIYVCHGFFYYEVIWGKIIINNILFYVIWAAFIVIIVNSIIKLIKYSQLLSFVLLGVFRK